MSYKLVVEGKGHITSKMVEDSTANGVRLSTIEVRYPRFIHCYDENTEVLTQIGDEIPMFRHFSAVKALQCKVAQYFDGVIEFVHPSAYIEEYSSDHRMVFVDNIKMSMSVTEGHRVYTHKRTTGNTWVQETMKANELLGGYTGSRRIPQAGLINTPQYLLNQEIALIMYYVADGHKPVASNKVQFHFRKKRKVDKVLHLLDCLNIEHTVHRHGDDVVISFDEPHWVIDCYTDLGDKKLPDILFNMSAEGYAHFKQACLESDGNVKNQEYNTGSDVLAHQMQVIAHIHDDSMNIRSYGGGGYAPMYKQRFKKTNYISFRKDKDTFTELKYDGVVYCVTVPSSYIMVRRKGIVMISGNSELMTHRVFSRNASSSRAIPSDTFIKAVEDQPARPIHWGKNQAGMQASEQLDSRIGKVVWVAAMHGAVGVAKIMKMLGFHKQIVNRLTEPFHFITVVITSTEWDNFFALRDHKDAQPEIRELAKCMKDTRAMSKPQVLEHGEWHLPYINADERRRYDHSILAFASGGRCARTSYLNHDKSDPVLSDDIGLFNMLVTRPFTNKKGSWSEDDPVHASPVEHQAQVISVDSLVDGTDSEGCTPDQWPVGYTHMNRYGTYWSGNLRGPFVQLRQLLDQGQYTAILGEDIEAEK